jgi:hypothetical protein
VSSLSAGYLSGVENGHGKAFEAATTVTGFADRLGRRYAELEFRLSVEVFKLGVLSTVLVTVCRPELNLTMLTLFTYASAGSNVIHRDRPLKCSGSPSLVQLEVVQLYSDDTALLLVQVDVVLAQTVIGLPARSVGRKPTVAWCNGPV